MNFEIVEMVHKQIILDLTIRTLERDRKNLENFKMQRPFEMWFATKINELHTELKNTKAKLSRNGAKVQTSKLDGDFTVYIIVERGVVSEKRYMNIALKNWTEEEVKRILGLEFKTPNDKK